MASVPSSIRAMFLAARPYAECQIQRMTKR